MRKRTTTLKQSRTTGYKNNSLPTPDNCPERGPSGSVKDQTSRGIYANDDGYRSENIQANKRTHTAGQPALDTASNTWGLYDRVYYWMRQHLTVRQPRNQPCKSRNNY